ncbi:hypothetical protein CAPTEDRAFT_214720, partial [Capitella teleta]
MAESLPSAPSLDKMDDIGGYSGTSFNSVAAAPPAYEEALQQGPPERGPITSVPVINEEQAREALQQFVSQHCCYGKGPVRQMTFRDLKSSSAFHYMLETFSESRSTTWAYEPFVGQAIDGPQYGPAPGPWDIQAEPQVKFQDAEKHLEVPHTASVK